jgi:hypothetical protein
VTLLRHERTHACDTGLRVVSASAVIMARDGMRTTLTMQNDYRGEPTEFALVVPVPVVLKQGDVKVVEKKIFDRVDAYSSPRLAEYYDADPCLPVPMPAPPMSATASGRASKPEFPQGAPALATLQHGEGHGPHQYGPHHRGLGARQHQKQQQHQL